MLLPLFAHNKLKSYPKHPDAPRVAYVEIDKVLGGKFDFDAHFAQYSAPTIPHRLSKPAAEQAGACMVLRVFDVDDPDAHALEQPASEEWRAAESSKQAALANAHPGLFLYSTRGGYRVVGALSEPRTVAGWADDYAADIAYLRTRFGIEADPICNDWTRIFRVPHGARDGIPQRFAPLHGDPTKLGFWARPTAIPSAVEDFNARIFALSMLGEGDHRNAEINGLAFWAGRRADHLPEDTPERIYAAAEQCGYVDKDGAEAALASIESGWEAGLAKPVLPPAAPGSTPAGPLKRTSWDDLMQPLGPVPWLCQGLGIVPGRPTIVFGASGSGKTWAIQEFALAVATGTPAFGRHAVQQGRVLHLDLDQGARATQERYQALAIARGGLPNGAQLEVVTFGLRLTDANAREVLLAETKGHTLVVIDSLRAASDGDENTTEFAQSLAMLAEVSNTTGCTCLVLHHEGHSNGRARGTSAIVDRAGAMWRVSREQDGPAKFERTKASEFDTGPRPPPFWTRLELDQGHDARLDRSGARVVVCEAPEGVDEGEARMQTSKLYDTIRRVVTNNPCATINALHAAVGGRKGDVCDAVNELLVTGDLWNVGTAREKALVSTDPLETVHAQLVEAGKDGATLHMVARATRFPPKAVLMQCQILEAEGRAASNGQDGLAARWIAR